MDEVYEESQESENKVCHINARTRPLFKEMLNKIGTSVKIGSSNLHMDRDWETLSIIIP